MSTNASAIPTLTFPDDDGAKHAKGASASTTVEDDSTAHSSNHLYRFSLLVIVVSAVALAIYLGAKQYLPSNNAFTTSLPSSFSQIFEIGGAPNNQDISADAGNASLSTSVVQTPTVASKPPPGIETELRALKIKMVTLEKTNKDLNDSVNAANAALADEAKKIEYLSNNFTDITKMVLPSLAAKNQVQDSMISDVQSSVERLTRRRAVKAAKAKKMKATIPPFTVVSVDEWDTTTSAVIELEGKSSVAAVGDIRAGWRITSIARPYCIQTMRVDGGKEVKVCVPGVM